ncbi:ELM1/GtrOC1 family putative glycosyltransferase [Sphingomonas alba]|uniref:Mitochondrial fission ELM1 family protein n=1 Tax=Sphingomonas alba TaxID=2908208 RepID=A0ABT0RJI8_9SPHN|nr:ELM1/GtrOC1 family putative glycosyltransferase [Sphingomonas alba]MCL6682765.1 mitochondrial fission ELM1 family protein [Sphingomonas alba]
MRGSRVWVLLGPRTGDNNQALALAEALELPFETRTLSYNPLQALSVWLPGTAATLDSKSRKELHKPWPDLVIAIGRRSVPVARWIKRKSRGQTKLVRIGHPRIDPNLFDLVITTRQYPVPPGENVLLLPLAMSRFSTAPIATDKEAAWLAALPSPRRLLAIGGATKYWSLSAERVAEAVERLQTNDGTLIVATSRRTDPEVSKAVRGVLSAKSTLVEGAFPRFPVLLDQADEIFVTGDSVSMLSEAILTGKPVGLVPIQQDEKGRRKLGEAPLESGPDARRRDLRRFWNYLQEEKIIGTVDAPVAAKVENPVETAARAVRNLLGDLG